MKKTTINVVPIDNPLGLAHTQIADAWAIYSYPMSTLLRNYANVVVVNIFGDEGCPWYALQTKQGTYELLLDRSEYAVDNIDKVIEMCEAYYKEVEPIK
jgi:hypothetical protein